MLARRPLTTLAAGLTLALAGAGSAAAAPVSTDGLARQAPARSGPAVAHAAQAGAPTDDMWALKALGMVVAWLQSRGDGITVAVLDSGANMRHRDLASHLWTNPADGSHGYDFVSGDSDPSDGNGHGTHVAGIVASIAPQARLMIVRVLDNNAGGTTNVVAKGMRYAVDNGARIVNLSLAGSLPSSDLQSAIQYAHDHGVLVVAAAGNDSRDLAKTPSYPASYPDDNIVGVSATSENGKLAQISNYGAAGGADIAAPGEDILSTSIDGGYEWRTGTSMAAPAVSGELALLAAVRPDLDAGALLDALFAGTNRTGLPVASGSADATGALRQVVAAADWRSVPATARATTSVPARAVVTLKRTGGKQSTAAKRLRRNAAAARTRAARGTSAKRAHARKQAKRKHLKRKHLKRKHLKRKHLKRKHAAR